MEEVRWKNQRRKKKDKEENFWKLTKFGRSWRITSDGKICFSTGTLIISTIHLSVPVKKKYAKTRKWDQVNYEYPETSLENKYPSAYLSWYQSMQKKKQQEKIIKPRRQIHTTNETRVKRIRRKVESPESSWWLKRTRRGKKEISPNRFHFPKSWRKLSKYWG